MQGDVVRDFINRVGAPGLIVAFSLVFFAFLAGGIVAHRLNASNSAAVQQQGGDQADQQGDQKDETQGQGNGNSNGKTKPKPPNQGQGDGNDESSSKASSERD
jgi:hypothetical protein